MIILERTTMLGANIQVAIQRINKGNELHNELHKIVVKEK
jgi:hypothetical protein